MIKVAYYFFGALGDCCRCVIYCCRLQRVLEDRKKALLSLLLLSSFGECTFDFPRNALGQLQLHTTRIMDATGLLLNIYHILALYLVAKHVSVFLLNLFTAVYVHFIASLICKPVDLAAKYGKWAGKYKLLNIF